MSGLDIKIATATNAAPIARASFRLELSIGLFRLGGVSSERDISVFCALHMAQEGGSKAVPEGLGIAA